MSIRPIPAFNDNYIWCLEHHGQAVLVDPGDAVPVLKYLQANDLQLSAILITHHHHDHIGGVADLLKQFPVTVYAPASGDYDFPHQPVAEGDRIELAAIDCHLTVMEVPGHTLDHIAYYNDEALFCGDTLFAGGCGRIFEGTPEMMYQSLMRLAALPAETKVYCAHEYTLSNLHFAESVDADNEALKQRIAVETAKRERGEPTLPSAIGLELKTNPFLCLPVNQSRVSLDPPDKPGDVGGKGVGDVDGEVTCQHEGGEVSRHCERSVAIQSNQSLRCKDNIKIFAELRALKDRF